VRVFFSNLGCKLNQAEIDTLARQFRARGHHIVRVLADADLHVVNSCTVTHQAARDSRKTARRAGRDVTARAPSLTGCYATASGDEAAALAGVDLVVANADKDRLVDLATAAFPDFEISPGPGGSREPRRTRRSRSPTCRWRSALPAPLVKIEDGCDMQCSFCIIPRTRGPQRSRPAGRGGAEVTALEAAGHREIVVTGVQISAYRDGDAGLAALLDALLAATSFCRFRLTSIAPWELDAALLDRLAHPRVCRHLHLSLQSGDDRTLRRMRRPYTAARFASLLDEVRRRVQGCAVTTDVIAGFPGETDDDFEASLAFVAAARFAKAHVFTYSAREGTAAASFGDPVPPQRRHERTARLRETAAAAEEAFRRAHLGTVARVLWEGRRDGAWIGTSDNYLRVFARDRRDDLRGRLDEVRLIGLAPLGLTGDSSAAA
jgi:threonylcarbamoyladenosine tRNA methylthiotransferase MtaB